MMNLKYQLPHGMKNLNYLMDHILYQIIIKKHETVTDNTSIMIYVNKIEIRITFTIKTGYYLKLLTPETMKLLGNTKNKLTKDENGENIPHLEITEVALVHCNIAHNNYQQDSRVLYTFAPNNCLVNYQIYHPIILYF